MRKTLKANKGFSLIEIIVSLGISFLLLLVIYKAYFLSTVYFSMGVDTIQEQAYLRKIFSAMDNDLRYLNRFNSVTPEQDSLEFEIFNLKILEEDKNTNDKKVEGQKIVYATEPSKDRTGFEYKILTKTADIYEWWMKFGHSQSINDEVDPPGYTEDMLDPVTGRVSVEAGAPEEILDQDEAMPFLITTIRYVPYDKEGKALESIDGFEYAVLKDARSLRVEIEYMMKSEYGDAASGAGRKKTASTNISFISFAEND